MKKIAFMLGLAAVATGFSACNETWDDNPTLKAPNTEYTDFLNEPELRETWITLDKDGADKEGALHMTCSQPDYGYAAIVNYVVEVCLTPHFTKPYTDGQPLETGDYYSTEYPFTDCAQINPVGDEIAECICKLKGWASEDDVTDEYMKVYVRLRAYIPENEALTTIYSQPKSFEHIRVSYYAASVPGQQVDKLGLYLRGDMNGWGTGPEYEFFTTAKRGIYVLENATIKKGEKFKFADSGWSDINLGAGANCTIGTAFRLDCGGGSGNLTCPDDFEGRILVINKGGVWRGCLQKAGTFDPDKLEYTL